ncbi:MAG: hypothetical protein K0R90_327 [Oscillospiraceae bacterium]|nr:hypothetical protein [Oscillospiraceae bacterium]
MKTFKKICVLTFVVIFILNITLPMDINAVGDDNVTVDLSGLKSESAQLDDSADEKYNAGKTEKITEEEMIQEAKDQEQAINNGQFVKANLTEDEYGGIYIDENDVLNVNLKDMNKKDLLKDRNIIIHPCENSMAELKQVFDLLFAETDTFKIDKVSIDEINNDIKVVKDTKEEVKDKVSNFKLDLGNRLSSIDAQSSVVKNLYEDVKTSKTVGSRAGKIAREEGEGYYSLGFYATDSSGRFGVVTAGHCVSAGKKAYVGEIVSVLLQRLGHVQ